MTAKTRLLTEQEAANEIGMSVHWLENGAGYLPDDSNALAYKLIDGGLEIVSPVAIPAKQYQLLIGKADTGESITVAGLLTAEDDTAPRVQSLQAMGYTASVKLVFNEAVQAGSYTVVAEALDYSASSQVNISDQFELLQRDNTLELRLKPGSALQNNYHYQLSIDGIRDIAGNTPINYAGSLSAGRYTQSLVTEDTLAPQQLKLTRASDGQVVTPAMTLTRGRSYQFTPGAIDNASEQQEISYQGAGFNHD